MSGETPGDFPPIVGKPLPAFSGRYESRTRDGNGLDLRVDIDVRAQNSPVMNCVSGDFLESSNYTKSWICINPTINISGSMAEITGDVYYWKPNIYNPTTIHITILRSFTGDVGPAVVTLTPSIGKPSSYTCERKSHCFRSLTVEVDILKQVHKAPIFPYYDVTSHPDHPADISPRQLSYTLALREAGVCVSIKPQNPQIIDDYDEPEFEKWDFSELHDAMENYFSKYNEISPKKWNLWCLQCGLLDDPDESYIGAMFDLGGLNQPERQGFAVFRNSSHFQHLVPFPTNADQAASMRWFLRVFVHETGHAFNLIHPDEKYPKELKSLSWMNKWNTYDPEANDSDSNKYWENFRYRFDDDELIHIRHGDRAAVIMGGDALGSAPYWETNVNAAPSGAMSQFEGQPPIELLIRSQDYFDYLEPVGIEARVRNLQCQTMMVDRRLSPEHGGLTLYIRRPNGITVRYLPIIYVEGFPNFHSLGPQNSNRDGDDRFSEYISINYGKLGFYFDQPGEYLVRTLYHTKGMVIPSNTLHLRIGYPASNEESQLASKFFTYQVGMSMYLNGSESPFLAAGKNLLELVSEKYKKTLLGAKISAVLAASEARPFFRIQDNALRHTHKPNYEKALSLTEPAVDVYRKQKDKHLNILYHLLVRSRANYLVKLGQKKEASNELSDLRKDLKARGVKESVLKSIESFQESL